MTVTQLIEKLSGLPGDAVVIMANDDGMSMVDTIDFVAAAGPGAPAEVILLPHAEE
jgi:hypothetical protein